jgi:hypothetical protein
VHSEVACWLYTGERQSAVIRSRGVQILLKQDLGYFDRFAGSGVFVSQISSDVLSVHHTLSEKVNLKFQTHASYYSLKMKVLLLLNSLHSTPL